MVNNVIISESDESCVTNGSEFLLKMKTLGDVDKSVRYYSINNQPVRIVFVVKAKGSVKIKHQPSSGGNAITLVGKETDAIVPCEPYSLMEMIDIVDKTMGNDGKYSLKSMSEMIEIRIERVIDSLNEKCSQSEIQELVSDYYKYMSLNRLLVEFIDVFSQRTTNKLSNKVISSYEALVKAYKDAFELTLVCKRKKKASSDNTNPLKEFSKGFEDKGWVVVKK